MGAKLALLALFSVQGFYTQPAGCDMDAFETQWNAFAHAANEYIHTLEANQAVRQMKKEHIGRMWDRIYTSPCF